MTQSLPDDTALTIALPAVSEAEVASGLRQLTRRLEALGHSAATGVLDGEDGYGVTCENDTFSMNPFCWCDADDCALCAPCTCPETAWHYFVDGGEVSFEDYDQFFETCVAGLDVDDPLWHEKAVDANMRRTTSHDRICYWCTHEDLKRPNFFHKPTKSAVR